LKEKLSMSASKQYILGKRQEIDAVMFISGDNPHCCGYVATPDEAKTFSSPDEALAYRGQMPWSRGGGPEQYQVFEITPEGISPV
jgi:hypothetical protein